MHLDDEFTILWFLYKNIPLFVYLLFQIKGVNITRLNISFSSWLISIERSSICLDIMPICNLHLDQNNFLTFAYKIVDNAISFHMNDPPRSSTFTKQVDVFFFNQTLVEYLWYNLTVHLLFNLIWISISFSTFRLTQHWLWYWFLGMGLPVLYSHFFFYRSM